MKPLSAKFRSIPVSQNAVTELPSSPSSPRPKTSLQATLPPINEELQSLTPAQLKTVKFIETENNEHISVLIAQLKKSGKIIGLGHKEKLIAAAQISQLAAVSRASDNTRKKVESLLRKAGLLKTSGKLLNSLLRRILKLNKSSASKYALAILYSWERGISNSEFVEFVKKEGGIEKINRKLSEAKKPHAQKTVTSNSKNLSAPLTAKIGEKIIPLQSDEILNSAGRSEFNTALIGFLNTNAHHYVKKHGVVTFLGFITWQPDGQIVLEFNVTDDSEPQMTQFREEFPTRP